MKQCMKQCKIHCHKTLGSFSSNMLLQNSWPQKSRKFFIKYISAKFMATTLQEVFHQIHQCKIHGHKTLGSFSSKTLSAKFMAATLQEVFHQMHQGKMHGHNTLGSFSSNSLVQNAWSQHSRKFFVKFISAKCMVKNQQGKFNEI